MTPEQDINKKIYLTCDCGLEIMQVVYNLEFNPEGYKRPHRQEWYFAIFKYTGEGKLSIWRRTKIAWQYLWTGKMYQDQIELNEEEADKLAKFIKQNNFAKCVKK